MALNHEVTGSVNYTVVGSPTIVDGVVSGFSGSDYLTIPSAISTASNFEICVKIDENSTSGDTCYPLGTDVPYGITFSTNAARLYLSSNGSSWDMAGEQTDINLPNNCYARVRFDGAKYIYDYSLDKTSWIVINTVNNSTKINSAISNIKLGGWWGAYYFTGSIDLNNTYIKVNGQALFGNCPVEVKHIDYGTSVGYTKVGSPTIVDGVVSGFSSSDYITIPYNNNDKKEVVFNFTTPSSFKNYDGLYDCYGAYIYLKSNGKMEAMYGSGGSNRWKEIPPTSPRA